jgi:hypothetical protein
MSESSKIQESNLANFPFLNQALKSLESPEEEFLLSDNMSARNFLKMIEKFPDMLPVLEFILDPSSNEDAVIAKVLEINSSQTAPNEGMYNSVSFGTTKFKLFENGRFTISYSGVN